MSEAVRPLRLLSTSALDWLRARAAGALDVWAREWTQDLGRPPLQVVPLSGCTLPRWKQHPYEVLETSIGRMWIRQDGAARRTLCRTVTGRSLMPGSDYADDWIANLAQQAWSARNHALCTALLKASASEQPVLSTSDLPAELFAFGSGAVHLLCEPLALWMVADAGVWCDLPDDATPSRRSRPPLTSLEQAAQGAVVRLEVVLGEVDIELPRLLDLRCGDVLRLTRRLDAPMAVLCTDKPLARAALGERGGYKSVKIIAGGPAEGPGV